MRAGKEGSAGMLMLRDPSNWPARAIGSQLSAAQARRSSGERNHVRVRRSAQLQADRDERWAGRISFLGFGYVKAWEIYSAAASTSRIHSSSLPYRGPRARRSSGERNHVRVRRSAQLQADRDP